MQTGLVATLSLAVASLNVVAQKAYFAPAPPPIIYSTEKPKPAADASLNVAQAAVQFSIGDPTDEEQLHLELINRARADANAEAQRLIELAITDPDVNDQFFRAWNVDTNLMKAQFSTNPPVAPLSFNAKLINAARGHSQYMFDNAVQAHTEPTPSLADPGARAKTAGYQYLNLGENVFLNATSVQQGHAAFDVDWGPGPGGMQSPPGHRNTIHSGSFVEVGIGVIKGTNKVNGNEAGPQVVTEDFGAPLTATHYITGVAYYDINGNNFYDLGEGLPGVRVTVDGTSTFAITTTSGGYSIPVTPNASHTVRFNANGYTELASVVGPSPNNIKVDFKPPYVVPTATGPSIAYQGIENVYNIVPLPGATGYRGRLTPVTATPPEGAEGALDQVTVTITGDYPYISTTRHASGSKSFHLGHANLPTIDPQIIAFNHELQVLENARVDFQSLLAFAGEGEVAKFQVSSDNGVSWDTLWSQTGDQSEETVFSAQSASLAPYANKRIRVRFVFDYTGHNLPAAILPDPSDPAFDHIGWFLDDITFVNTETRLDSVESNIITDTRVILGPMPTGKYLMEFQYIVGARTFEYGPAREITVAANPPVVSLAKNINATPTTVSLQFTLSSGTASSFQIESAASVNGPWSVESGATITSNQGVYTATIPTNGAIRFYRVVAN